MSLNKIYKIVKGSGYRWFPWLFLAISLPVTFYVWQSERHNALTEHQLKFESRVKEAANLINKQLSLHQQSLLGIQSLFRASSYVSEEEFNAYVKLLLMPEVRYGLQDIGFAKYIKLTNPETFGEFGADVQSLLEKISQDRSQLEYAPIIYVVSVHTSSKAPVVDAFSNPKVKQSLLNVTKRNSAVAFEKINVHAEDLDHCQCFSLQIPIYTTAIQKDNPQGNPSDIYGWVFFNIDQAAFFNATLRNVNDGLIKFSVYDGQLLESQHVVYENQKSFVEDSAVNSQFVKKIAINSLGHTWTLNAKSTPIFEEDLDYLRANQLGIFGLLINLALTGIFYLLLVRVRALNNVRDANKQLSDSEQRWKFALEGSGDGVWDWDINANKVMFSKRWKEMLGFQEHEITGDYAQWEGLIHPEDYPNVKRALSAALKGQTPNYAIECRLLCKDRSWKWVLSRGLVVSRDERAKPLRMVGTQTDISYLKESEEAIWQHANFDALTGLPNRRMFYSKLEQEIQKAKRGGLRVGLIFLDLDRFKEVNDTLGHDQGDILLKLTADRLLNCMRGTDSVARLGGDEFVILIGEIDQKHSRMIETVSQKVLKTIAEPFELTHEKAYVSASLGIAIFPDDAVGIDGLLKSVDQAMYASKNKGGNCFTYFTLKMQEIAFNRMQLSNDLRMALPRQELFIEYQPIVELGTGCVFKAEALLRWQHPERGLVPPIEFIPIAEDTRLINEIGNWVFEHGIQQAVAWRKNLDPEFQVTINKSPVQFNNLEANESNWIDNLQRDQQDGSAVVVEITESLLLDASSKVKDRLKLYQNLGIQVALDDFGTGYSSLSYLKKFDIDYLKIDKSFVANLDDGSDDYVLCEAIIMMAHRLGIKVIAEGIETEKQKALLTQAGCDFGQGYYFSKPISAEKFEQFVKDRHTEALTIA